MSDRQLFLLTFEGGNENLKTCLVWADDQKEALITALENFQCDSDHAYIFNITPKQRQELVSLALYKEMTPVELKVGEWLDVLKCLSPDPIVFTQKTETCFETQTDKTYWLSVESLEL